MKRITVLFGMLAVTASGATLPMDSERGDKLFQSQGCVQCHKLKGTGGIVANDLGRVLDRAYSPADLASTMWNHAPQMWKAIRDRGLKVGDLDPQNAADLFASFYSARYFDVPGDAARGKYQFADKTCASCHGLSSPVNEKAQPVSKWTTLGDPVSVVSSMWVHSPEMRSELQRRNKQFPAMTAQELTDILVYLRNSTPAKNAPASFRITASEGAAQLAAQKGCVSCHKDPKVLLSKNTGPMTLTAVAASMWNHLSMKGMQHPAIAPGEMRELVGYYWAAQFFQGSGVAARGKKVFAAKRCVGCHAGGGAGPVLSAKAGTWNGITMVSGLWRHGPTMLSQMEKEHIPWPVFKVGEMDDLIAFMNSAPGN
jgi:cytochrome c551/c552